MVAGMRQFNPDRALQRWDRLARTVGSIRAQRLTLTQGKEAGATCSHCGSDQQKVARIETKVKTPVFRDGVIVNHATVRVFERWELQCERCSFPWPLLDAETKKPQRRRREPARAYDPSTAHAELLDLDRVFRRPAGFTAERWRLYLDLWRGLLAGTSYDELAEGYGGRLVSMGVGQGDDVSGRTVARLVRIARDLVESALEEQAIEERAATLRYEL